MRTMFFERLGDNQAFVTFNGVQYPVSAGANLDHWNCRLYLTATIWPKLDREQLEDLNAITYKVYKADVVKILKEWDKRYMKHMKSTNLELGSHQKECMMPLTNLFQSNFNFFCLNQMIKK